jgi:hypothetical protein
MSNSWYVRLKPYNPKLGCVVERYHVAGNLYITDSVTEQPVWYKVDDLTKQILEPLRQQETEPLSPELFDIVTEEEYLAINKRLRLVRLGMMTATAVQSVSSAPVVDRVGATGRSAAIPEAMPVAAVPGPVPPSEPSPSPMEVVEPVASDVAEATAESDVATKSDDDMGDEDEDLSDALDEDLSSEDIPSISERETPVAKPPRSRRRAPR